MDACTSKPTSKTKLSGHRSSNMQVKEENSVKKDETEVGKKSQFFPFLSPSPAHYLFSQKSSPATNSTTPRRFLKRPLMSPSPAKHIKALARSMKPNTATIPENDDDDGERNNELDKRFNFSKNFEKKYEIGEEVGRAHFGHTCKAKFKKGEFKGQDVAVKVIPKSKVRVVRLPYLHDRYRTFCCLGRNVKMMPLVYYDEQKLTG